MYVYDILVQNVLGTCRSICYEYDWSMIPEHSDHSLIIRTSRINSRTIFHIVRSRDGGENRSAAPAAPAAPAAVAGLRTHHTPSQLTPPWLLTRSSSSTDGASRYACALPVWASAGVRTCPGREGGGGGGSCAQQHTCAPGRPLSSAAVRAPTSYRTTRLTSAIRPCVSMQDVRRRRGCRHFPGGLHCCQGAAHRRSAS
eukprot:COSAG02_NODE_2924_length_7735_cov_4.298324_9_plen_199_part_00